MKKIGKKLLEAKNLYKEGNYDGACVACGAILENNLKNIFKMYRNNIPFKERNELNENEKRIGKNQKGIDDFTLSELIRLFKDNNILKKWSTVNRLNQTYFYRVDLSVFINLRNHGAHDKNKEISSEDVLSFIDYVNNMHSILNSIDKIGDQTEVKKSSSYSINDVDDMLAYVKKTVINSTDNEVMIKNIALTMESSWPSMKLMYKKNIENKNTHFKGLIINSSIFNKESINIPKSWEVNIEHSIKDVNVFIEKNREIFEKNNCSIAIKKNNSIPIIHGFLINDKYLFWSFLEIENNEIDGGSSHYNYNTIDDEIGSYYIRIFRNWFNHWWENGENV